MIKYLLLVLALFLTLAGFSKKSPAGKIIVKSFEFPKAGDSRKVRIYLPPDYETSQKKYPVLYMHDGQTIFHHFRWFDSSWDVDKSMNTIYAETGKCAIIVGIDNGGNSSRINELSPFKSPKYGGGGGDMYAAFLVNTIKPYIDATYRTLKDRENTASAGSSLGGLMAFYLAFKYPGVFGKVGAFSPIILFSEDIIPFIKLVGYKGTRFYFVGSEKDHIPVVDIIKKTVEILKTAGYKDNETKVVITSDGAHAGWYWKREFPAAFKWLFL